VLLHILVTKASPDARFAGGGRLGSRNGMPPLAAPPLEWAEAKPLLDRFEWQDGDEGAQLGNELDGCYRSSPVGWRCRLMGFYSSIATDATWDYRTWYWPEDRVGVERTTAGVENVTDGLALRQVKLGAALAGARQQRGPVLRFRARLDQAGPAEAELSVYWPDGRRIVTLRKQRTLTAAATWALSFRLSPKARRALRQRLLHSYAKISQTAPAMLGDASVTVGRGPIKLGDR
jgi:hypothetical protein